MTVSASVSRPLRQIQRLPLTAVVHRAAAVVCQPRVCGRGRHTVPVRQPMDLQLQMKDVNLNPVMMMMMMMLQPRMPLPFHSIQLNPA